MLFSSFHFLVFFIVVTAFYFALPGRSRWWWLLMASCYFYMAFVPIYILILGFTIVIDYFAGIHIEKSEGQRRKFFLTLSIIANVGVLVVFKYYNFFVDNISWTLTQIGMHPSLPYLSILLPIGLSFHTFQAMSYTIEVYRGHQPAERHFGIYALYVMFYPQLVSGPIERPQNLLHQLRATYPFDAARISNGLKLIGWGLFKKVVIADRLAIVVDRVFNNYLEYDGLSLVVATLFFSFQIYCDFSGYSDIAIGAAQVMGFKLMTNFNRPYVSSSISEFWKRWHISLSTWFRDYLYISLGGNRVGIPRWYLNLFIVFIVSGLWHGANWTFVAWGALHGFYLVIGLITEKFRWKGWLKSLPGVQMIVTFLLVTFAWIFFRADSLTSSIYISTHLFQDWPEFSRVLDGSWLQLLRISGPELLFDFLLISMLLAAEYVHSRRNLFSMIDHQPTVVRWSIYYVMIVSITLLGIFGDRQFIYFQF